MRELTFTSVPSRPLLPTRVVIFMCLKTPSFRCPEDNDGAEWCKNKAHFKAVCFEEVQRAINRPESTPFPHTLA